MQRHPATDARGPRIAEFAVALCALLTGTPAPAGAEEADPASDRGLAPAPTLAEASTAANAIVLPPLLPDAAAPASGSKSQYVIGTALIWAPEYTGAGQQAFKLRPLFAYQYGRFRISTSRASGVLDFGNGSAGPGATAELLKRDNWKLGAGLRFDGGRQASDSPDLAGLPEIRRTLRGRIYTSYAFDANWGAGATVSQDLLGHQGGAVASFSAGYRDRLTQHSEWSAGTGLSFGNARHMKTYFGVSDAAAQTSGLAAFEPGAGVKDLSLGIGVTTELTSRWIGFAGVGASRLLGDAAASPLTKRSTTTSANVGIAYRCCK